MKIGNAHIELLKGDITRLEVDAVVNAANSSLMGGGGVDGAIHRAGGREILEACKVIVASQGRCPTGKAVNTTAGNLPARFVIHTVGPVWHGGKSGEPEALASCYRESLDLALKHGCRSVAFPCISTGVYGYPKEQAAEVAVQALDSWSQIHSGIEKVMLVCFDDENYACLQEALNSLKNE